MLGPVYNTIRTAFATASNQSYTRPRNPITPAEISESIVVLAARIAERALVPSAPKGARSFYQACKPSHIVLGHIYLQYLELLDDDPIAARQAMKAALAGVIL